LREKLIASKSRIVVVSSGSVRSVTDTNALDDLVKAQSGADAFALYPATKFTQLLNAHWWRRQLQDQCRVVAVSPGQCLYTPYDLPKTDLETYNLVGFIPDTGIRRHLDEQPPVPAGGDAKTVAEGILPCLVVWMYHKLTLHRCKVYTCSLYKR
jgi:nucleoside-diphosphate-sugar epimerase